MRGYLLLSGSLALVLGIGNLASAGDRSAPRASGTSRAPTRRAPGGPRWAEPRHDLSSRFREPRRRDYEQAAQTVERWLNSATRQPYPEPGLLQVLHWGVSDNGGVKIREDHHGLYLEVGMFQPNRHFDLDRAAELVKERLRGEQPFAVYRQIRVKTVRAPRL